MSQDGPKLEAALSAISKLITQAKADSSLADAEGHKTTARLARTAVNAYSHCFQIISDIAYGSESVQIEETNPTQTDHLP